MSVHDAVLAYQNKLVVLIESSPNRRAACREVGIHHSTFYRWRARVRGGVEPQRRRRWRDLGVESQVVAVALAHPGLGPQRLAWELATTAGLEVSASTVWRILRTHRLNTRQLRYQLMAQHRNPVTVVRRRPDQPVGHLDASVPGDLVQMDCFYVGSFKETRLTTSKGVRGHIWQYTAIDVASSFLWAELWASARNPDPARTTALAYRVAADLKTWGWTPTAITTDNGNEFRSQRFRTALADLAIDHRFIKAGRPQTNGKVERVHGTLLDELYKPVLSTYAQPSITGLRRDLNDYLTYYNWQRPHTGKWNQGQPPATIIQPKTKLTP